MNKYAEFSRAPAKPFVPKCASKTKFWTEKSAEKAAQDKGLFAYKCSLCRWWHLTKHLFAPAALGAHESSAQ